MGNIAAASQSMRIMSTSAYGMRMSTDPSATHYRLAPFGLSSDTTQANATTRGPFPLRHHGRPSQTNGNHNQFNVIPQVKLPTVSKVVISFLLGLLN